MAKITMKVSGMHCASCEMLIKDVLEELDGVEYVIVKEDKVDVEFDDSRLKQHSLKKAISNEGYGVQ